MAFNDDDLKWLKEAANHRRDKLSSIVYVDLPEVDALLARMEAAETIVDMMANGTTTKKYQIALEAWRKACGNDKARGIT